MSTENNIKSINSAARGIAEHQIRSIYIVISMCLTAACIAGLFVYFRLKSLYPEFLENDNNIGFMLCLFGILNIWVFYYAKQVSKVMESLDKLEKLQPDTIMTAREMREYVTTEKIRTHSSVYLKRHKKIRLIGAIVGVASIGLCILLFFITNSVIFLISIIIIGMMVFAGVYFAIEYIDVGEAGTKKDIYSVKKAMRKYREYEYKTFDPEYYSNEEAYMREFNAEMSKINSIAIFEGQIDYRGEILDYIRKRDDSWEYMEINYIQNPGSKSILRFTGGILIVPIQWKQNINLYLSDKSDMSESIVPVTWKEFSTEDITFDNTFNIRYSKLPGLEDEDLFYWLTPQVMNTFSKLLKEIKQGAFLVADKKLYIFINNQNLFRVENKEVPDIEADLDRLNYLADKGKQLEKVWMRLVEEMI